MSQTRPWTGWASCLLRYIIPCFIISCEGHGRYWKNRVWWWVTQNLQEFLSFSVFKLTAVFTGYLFVDSWQSPEYLASSSYQVNELGEDGLLRAWHEPKLSVVLFWSHFLDCRNFQSPAQILARVNSLFLSDFAISLFEGNQSVYTSHSERNHISLQCLSFFFRKKLKLLRISQTQSN